MSEAAKPVTQPDKTPSKTPRTYAAGAYAATSPTSRLAPLSIRRREPGQKDVQIDILYCGVCHSDLHQIRNEWPDALPTVYPCVPGHEIVGRVTKVGSGVKKFKEGEIAAVGVMVDSCRTCASCREGLEQYCENGNILTYNAEDKHLGGVTYGGYSESVVVDEAFVFRVPEKLDLSATGPLLCAGITTYSPLRHWGIGKGQTVGVVGLGGLGHLGVKFAHALKAHVALFTTSPGKVGDARRLGADEVIVTRDAAELEKHIGRFDFILDTVSAEHNVNAYLELLKRDATLVLVGLPPKPLPVGSFSLLAGRHRLAGSGIGGVRETQEMLDFCAEHGINADVELIGIEEVDQAYERMLRGDVKYRFVIDMASLKGGARAG